MCLSPGFWRKIRIWVKTEMYQKLKLHCGRILCPDSLVNTSLILDKFLRRIYVFCAEFLWGGFTLFQTVLIKWDVINIFYIAYSVPISKHNLKQRKTPQCPRGISTYTAHRIQSNLRIILLLMMASIAMTMDLRQRMMVKATSAALLSSSLIVLPR
jgi:hypothetical protein